jgi:hypothetical protein
LRNQFKNSGRRWSVNFDAGSPAGRYNAAEIAGEFDEIRSLEFHNVA